MCLMSLWRITIIRRMDIIFEYTNAVRNGNGDFMIGRNNPELRYVCGQDFDSLYNDVMQNTQVQYNSELLEGINPEENTQ